MNSEFIEYYKKLVKIGKQKTAIYSVIIGFGANFIAAFIMMFIDMNVWAALGISLGAGIVAGLVSVPLLYYLKFKPTDKTVATILDKQGLEERMITMVELENDDSYIAKIQRENAISSLRKANVSLKFVVPMVLVILLAVSATIGLSMTTVTTLAAADIINIGKDESQQDNPDSSNPDDDEEPDDEESNVSILYEAGAGGKLRDKDGNLKVSIFQELKKGGDAAAVVAVPDEGYEFCYWTDGNFNAERQDREVMVSVSVQAVFQEIEVPVEGEDGDGEGGGEQGGGDEGGQGGGGEGGGQSGEGQGSGDGDGNGGETGPGGGGGGAGYNDVHDNNNVVDGKTDYHNEINYQAMKEQIENDNSLTQDEKDMLLSYLKLLMGDGDKEQ